jgi:gamma-glutamylcyclotransferase (GGCT)/AIG2-like uncharacterized protein YtfP
MSELVCVYGTLKRGKSNHKLMERVGTYVCDVVIEDMTMLTSDAYGFPAAIDELGSVIHAEVYQLKQDTLMAQLDWLEGYNENDKENSLFIRRPQFTTAGYAWIYTFNENRIAEWMTGSHVQRIKEWE